MLESQRCCMVLQLLDAEQFCLLIVEQEAGGMFDSNRVKLTFIMIFIVKVISFLMQAWKMRYKLQVEQIFL